MNVNFNSVSIGNTNNYKPMKKSNAKQPTFQAVNKYHYQKAENWYKRRGQLVNDWYDCLQFDVVLFKEVSVRDAIDTLKAVRKFVIDENKNFHERVIKDYYSRL